MIDEKYFKGFERHIIDTGEVKIHAWVGGHGKEAVLLLHGHPESHLMWHGVAPELAKDYTVVSPDRRGYGESSKPYGTPDHATYSKRAMADDQVFVMKHLGFDQFHIAGHDRGGRVCHRMMTDHPDTVHAIAEDYRASVTVDWELDMADRSKKVKVPVMCLWGSDGNICKIWDVVGIWSQLAENVTGYGVPGCGHFVPEEKPEITAEKIREHIEKNK